MDIYIHVDKKFDNLKKQIITSNRIFISDKNISINWGTDSLLRCILIMMKEVLDSGKGYGQVLINADNDLLVKKGLDTFLDKHLDQVFVYSHEADKERRVFIEHSFPKYMMRQIDCRYDPVKLLRSLRMRIIRRLPFLFKRRLPIDISNITFYYSTFWGAIPYYIVKYILEYIVINPSFLQVFMGSFVAEESFLATLINLSPYRSSLHYDERGKTYSLTHILGVYNAHPLVIRKKDIPEINGTNCFFARKFDVRIDKDVVDYYYNMVIAEKEDY